MNHAFRLLTAVALAAQGLAAQTPTGTVSGTVRDELGRLVREALVVLDAETTPMRTRTELRGNLLI